MKVYCCQLDIVWENKDANFAKVRKLLGDARPDRGSLVVLPEMFATGFSMNLHGITDTPGGHVSAFVGQLATELGVYVQAGIATTGADNRGRNESILYSPAGQILCRYEKMHPFTLGGESIWYAAGKQICTHALDGFTLAPFVCYDLRFPEIFRAAVRHGANLYTVIANWPASREHHWVTLLQARAIENQAYVVGVNRCGNDPKFAYPGRSMIIDPRGQVLADAGSAEKVISAEIELEPLEMYRKDFPFLKDMHFNV